MTVKQRCPTVIFLLEEKKMVEKIKNGITEMVFIIDRSGSMAGMEEDSHIEVIFGGGYTVEEALEPTEE